VLSSHTNQVFYLAWGWNEDCWCKAIGKISYLYLEGSLYLCQWEKGYLHLLLKS
jgi:hypothetical protein